MTAADRPASLNLARTVPLDRLNRADLSPIVRRVLAAHLDQTRIPAAKFSSHI
ncbi:hypothetical protein ABZ949_02195 [Micromonospora tulbaghiae]|uniref:hypothetical protein n=1 Tax=Micromonospora tulbaghiae TaxID=479978 RepID=UPI003403D7DC